MVGSCGVLMCLGVVVMFCVVRVPMLGYGVALVKPPGRGGASFVMIRALADAAHAADNDAHQPQQRASPRENAEHCSDFRLPRNFHLQSLANLALGHVFRFYSLLAPG
jgi:hypothetical protein